MTRVNLAYRGMRRQSYRSSIFLGMPILIIGKKYSGARRPCSDAHAYFVVCISNEYAFLNVWFHILIGQNIPALAAPVPTPMHILLFVFPRSMPF